MLRIGIGMLTFIYLYQLYPLINLHFSPEGWQANPWKDSHNYLLRWSVINLVQDTTYVKLLWILTLCALVCFTIGLYTRICGLLSWIMLVSIWHYNPFVLDSDDALLRMSLLYLLFSPCGQAYSIVNKQKKLGPEQATIWPLRLLQFQLILVYFASGWFKFQNPEWMNGNVLKSVLMHPQYMRWELTWLVNQPWSENFLELSSQIICWWEMLFPLLISYKFSRLICLTIGIVFHLILFSIMHLRGFSIIMLVLYIAFLPAHWFQNYSE